MNEKFNVIEIGKSKNVFYCKQNDKEVILVKNADLKNELTFYENLMIKKGTSIKDAEEVISIEPNDKKFTKNIFNIIDDLYDELGLEEILKNLKILLKQNTNENFLKFRGDFGELIFAYYNDAKKASEFETFDFIFKNTSCEVKTYSNQKKEIILSNAQLEENTNKYAVLIENDNEGLTILELANEVKKKWNGKNIEFANHINKEYSNSVFNQNKIKLNEPIDITSYLKKIKIELPSQVRKATFVIKLNF